MFFGEINDVKFDGHSFGYVLDIEEEPLIIAFGVDIVLKDEIELIELFLIDPKQIPTFEIRIEFNLISEGDGCGVWFLISWNFVFELLFDNCLGIEDVGSIMFSILVSLVVDVFPFIVFLQGEKMFLVDIF